MPGNVSDDKVELVAIPGQKVEVVTADLFCRLAASRQRNVRDQREGFGYQASLNLLGDFEFLFPAADVDQLLHLLGISPGDADLTREALEQFYELLGEDPLCRA